MTMEQNNKIGELSTQEKEVLHNTYDEAIQKFTLMSDTFMSVVFKDKTCVGELLSVILDKKIKIIEVQTQYNIQSLKGHSVRLDVYAVDENDNVINIEVQNDNEGAVPERTRFHSSLMDMELLEKGSDFCELPEAFIIMLTRSDVLKGGVSVYHIDRKITELNDKFFGDRSHIIYVNGEIQDDTPIGRLMHDMQCNNAGDIYNSILADRVDYYKNKERGEYEMCEIMEKIAVDRESKAITATRLEDIRHIMMNFDMTAKKAMQGLNIPEDEYPIYLRHLGLDK